MQFPVKLSAKFLKRSYAKRLFPHWWLGAIAVVAIGYAVVSQVMRGGLSFFPIFGISLIVVYLLICGVAWLRQSRALDDWREKQGETPVLYSLSEDSIESVSEVGSTKLKWSAFRSLAITEFDTLLMLSAHGALTLPTDQIPDDVLEFLKKQFSAHGKKVTDARKRATQAPEPTAPSGRGSS
jgi:hypothetical protein